MYLLQTIWDPASDGIPLFGDFKIHYYSLMWMAAFVTGWYIMKKIYKNEDQSDEKLDGLFMYSVLGIMIGARLGHVIFYQSELFREDFLSVFLPFRFSGGFEFTGFRGLASHGAAIGMITSMYIYNKKILKKSVLWILDRVVIASALGAVFIRIGNFFNSEMIGKPTEEGFPIAIIFRQLDSVPTTPWSTLRSLWVFICLLNCLFHLLENKKRHARGLSFWIVFIIVNDRKSFC
jgi:prolipoprotein diacylglyceryl transferase